MRLFTPARALALVAVTVMAVGAPALPALAKRKPVAEAPPPPPPPPPAGPVGLPDRLISDAAGFEGYMLRVGATSPGFTSAETVSAALKNGAAYEPKAFIRGAIAYGAIAALKDPNFVASLRAAGNSPDNRRQMVADIISNPIYVFQFKGSDQAAGLARAALGETALRLTQTGRLIRQAAYDVQHQSWSKVQVVDLPGRLAAVEAESANGIAPAADEVPVLQKAATGAEPLPITAQPLAPPYAPLVARALQVAAIAALGEATDNAYDQIASMSNDMETELCLERAKRDLYQCLAVSKPNYEDIFCMGRHEMLQPSECVASGAGVDLPAEPAPPPAPAPTRVANRSSHHHTTSAHHTTHHGSPT
ncbi:MAG TPA: hypothetical protein VGH03_09875 [Caulobacteraceae bacterium]|jgi:hypothetical protein